MAAVEVVRPEPLGFPGAQMATSSLRGSRMTCSPGNARTRAEGLRGRRPALELDLDMESSDDDHEEHLLDRTAASVVQAAVGSAMPEGKTCASRQDIFLAYVCDLVDGALDGVGTATFGCIDVQSDKATCPSSPSPPPRERRRPSLQLSPGALGEEAPQHAMIPQAPRRRLGRPLLAATQVPTSPPPMAEASKRRRPSALTDLADEPAVCGPEVPSVPRGTSRPSTTLRPRPLCPRLLAEPADDVPDVPPAPKASSAGCGVAKYLELAVAMQDKLSCPLGSTATAQGRPRPAALEDDLVGSPLGDAPEPPPVPTAARRPVLMGRAVDLEVDILVCEEPATHAPVQPPAPRGGTPRRRTPIGRAAPEALQPQLCRENSTERPAPTPPPAPRGRTPQRGHLGSLLEEPASMRPPVPDVRAGPRRAASSRPDCGRATTPKNAGGHRASSRGRGQGDLPPPPAPPQKKAADAPVVFRVASSSPMPGGHGSTFVTKYRALSSRGFGQRHMESHSPALGADLRTLSPAVSAMAMDLGQQATLAPSAPREALGELKLTKGKAPSLPPIAPAGSSSPPRMAALRRLELEMNPWESRAHDNFTNLARVVM